jgi:N utilization substance protein A
LAEAQTEELPRRKGARGVASEPAAAVEAFEEGDGEPAADSPETALADEGEFSEADMDQSVTIPDAAAAEFDSALPTESESTAAGELTPDDGMDPERDEASENELHDVALATEKATYSPHGHEVTSPPSEEDQSETIRIVTEAVEQSGPGRPAAGPPPSIGEPSVHHPPGGPPSSTTHPTGRPDGAEAHPTDGA